MNNYKIKKIMFILSCFAAIITKCSEKRKNQDIVSTSKLYFLSLNTQTKFEKQAAKLPLGKNTIVSIECDMCDNIKTGKFSRVYAKMIDHRKVIHFVCKCNEFHKTLRKTFQCETCALKSQNKKSLFIPLHFSLDIQKKYAEIYKNSHVSIACDMCGSQRSGKFPVAYNNMLQHRKANHGNQ